MTDELATLATAHPQWARVLDGIARTWKHRHPDRRYAHTALRRHIQMRDRTCIFPGCRRPARKTDLDHTHDHAADGTTTQQLRLPLRHAPRTQNPRHLAPTPNRTRPLRMDQPLDQLHPARGEPVTRDLTAPQPENHDNHHPWPPPDTRPIINIPKIELDPPTTTPATTTTTGQTR